MATLSETLSEAFDGMRHDAFDLRDREIGADDAGEACHRPRLSLWPAYSDDLKLPVVNLNIGPLMGEQQRFVTMTVGEAREFARKIIGTCNLIDQVVGQHRGAPVA